MQYRRQKKKYQRFVFIIYLHRHLWDILLRNASVTTPMTANASERNEKHQEMEN